MIAAKISFSFKTFLQSILQDEIFIRGAVLSRSTAFGVLMIQTISMLK